MCILKLKVIFSLPLAYFNIHILKLKAILSTVIITLNLVIFITKMKSRLKNKTPKKA